jgi:hypothetical protein
VVISSIALRSRSVMLVDAIFLIFVFSAVVGYSKSLRDFIEDEDRTETKPKRTKTETNKKNNSITLFGNLPEN